MNVVRVEFADIADEGRIAAQRAAAINVAGQETVARALGHEPGRVVFAMHSGVEVASSLEFAKPVPIEDRAQIMLGGLIAVRELSEGERVEPNLSALETLIYGRVERLLKTASFAAIKRRALEIGMEPLGIKPPPETDDGQRA